MHISNRHMELGRVVAAVGAAEGLVTYLKQDDRPEVSPPDYKMNAIVAALAREPAHLGDLPRGRAGRRSSPIPASPAWTDDYSDILGAIMRKKFPQLTATAHCLLGELAQHGERLDHRRVPHLRPADIAETLLAMDQRRPAFEAAAKCTSPTGLLGACRRRGRQFL